MTKILFFLGFFATANVLTAQNLTPIAQLKKGDKIHHTTITYMDEATKQGYAAMGLGGATDSTVVTVIYDLIDDGGDNLTFSTTMQTDESTKALLGQFKMDDMPAQKYLIVTKKDGSNPTLKDEAAAVKAYKAQSDNLLDAMAKNPEVSPMMAMLKPMLEGMKDMFPDATIRQNLLNDALRLFVFQGETIVKGTPKKKENYMTTAGTDAMLLKTSLDYRLVNYNEGRKTAVVTANYITDTDFVLEEMTKMMKNMMAKMPMNGEKMPTDAQLREESENRIQEMNLNFTRNYIFDLKTGIPSMIIEKSVQKDAEGKSREEVKKRVIKVMR